MLVSLNRGNWLESSGSRGFERRGERPSELMDLPVIAAITVDLDKSTFIQMVVFSVLIVALKPLLFDPMMRLFALREERTDGAKAEARTMQEQAADILSSYEGKLVKIRAEAAAERESLRRETAKLEAEILEEARGAVDVITREGHARIAGNIEAFETELAAKEQTLALEIAGRVLGRELSA